jgi:hypothetical protein
MRSFFQAIKRLALWQKLAIGIMIILILLTWLAICLFLTGYWGP